MKGWGKPSPRIPQVAFLNLHPVTRDAESRDGWQYGKTVKIQLKSHALFPSLRSVRKEGCEARPMLERFFLVPLKLFGFTESHFMKSLSQTDEPPEWEVRISSFDQTVGGRPVFRLSLNLKRMGKGSRNWYPIWGFWVSYGILFMVLYQCEGGGVGCQNTSPSVTSCIRVGKHLTLRYKSFNHAESVVTTSCELLGVRNS